MELTEREKKKLYEAVKAEMIKQAHGISIADKMIKISGERIKLELEGRVLDAVYYPALSDDGSKLCGDGEQKAPLIAGFHGGGFLFGGCALNDAMWVAVSKALHSHIISVGYRKSPEHDWHDTLKDCADVINYLARHAADFHADPTQISVMGQSAGASLAATVALKFNLDKKGLAPGTGFDNIALDNLPNADIKNCILLYPLVDGAMDPDSKGEGSLSGPAAYVFNELHCNDGNVKNPLVSPVYASSEMLKGLPNTILVTCENDNLRHEAIKYAKMLKEAGISISHMQADGMPHAFFESGFKTPTDFEKQFLGENADELVSSGALHEWSVKTLEFIKENLTK